MYLVVPLLVISFIYANHFNIVGMGKDFSKNLGVHYNLCLLYTSCQRLALARALLHDSPVYIFDEATSNIYVESENDIMREIHRLAQRLSLIHI